MRDDRDQALEILLRVEREELFAAPLLDHVRGDDRDRRFIRTLVLGVLRWRGELDYVLEHLSGRRMQSLDVITRCIVRLGAFQILHTDVPPHAAVSESVTLAGRRAPRAKGLVNAVLRKVATAPKERIVPQGNDLRSAAARLSHPEWLLKSWAAQFGNERALKIAAANQEPSYPDLWVNPKRLSVDDLLAHLELAGGRAKRSPLFDDFVRLEGSTALVAEQLARGEVYAMDEGSAVVARLVDPAARSVLDLTAAPGGKSLLLAARGQAVVSHDLVLERLQLLRKSAPQLLGEAPRIVVGDGRQTPFRGGFDSVLLDAPCSATGTIRRNPELKWRLRPEDPSKVATLQRELLHAALSLAEGECIYATCSLQREENDAVVEAVLAEREDFQLAPFSDLQPSVRGSLDGRVLRLTPEGGTDGFTVQRLVRRGGRVGTNRS